MVVACQIRQLIEAALTELNPSDGCYLVDSTDRWTIARDSAHREKSNLAAEILRSPNSYVSRDAIQAEVKILFSVRAFPGLRALPAGSMDAESVAHLACDHVLRELSAAPLHSELNLVDQSYTVELAESREYHDCVCSFALSMSR